jgi:hypothetical protein
VIDVSLFLSDIDTVVRHTCSVINHCDRRITLLLKSDLSITDLSRYVSDYCISITKKSDTSITVIYHAMSLTTVNITKKSDMSLTTVSVSLRRVIRVRDIA